MASIIMIILASVAFGAVGLMLGGQWSGNNRLKTKTKWRRRPATDRSNAIPQNGVRATFRLFAGRRLGKGLR
jgi:hypothetical protein